MMRVNAFSSAMRLDGGEKFFWDAASVCAFEWAENQLKFCSLNYIQLNSQFVGLSLGNHKGFCISFGELSNQMTNEAC